jgi:hypothetical protein
MLLAACATVPLLLLLALLVVVGAIGPSLA